MNFKDIKLIISDIDGTLVKDGTLAINPEYFEVIEKLIDLGVTFAVCSGRQFVSESKLFAPIKEKIMYMGDGGSFIRSYDTLLKTYEIEEHIWKGMYESMKELPQCDFFIGTPEYALAPDAGSKMFRWLKDSYGFDVRPFEDLSEIEKLEVIKFSVYHPDACEEMCKPSFTPKWQNYSQMACAGKEWMDCTSLLAGKGPCTKWLQNYLNVSADETCTFGDNMNDIPMLKNARYSFAVSNARSEVKAAAKYTCAPYWEFGELEILKQILKEKLN